MFTKYSPVRMDNLNIQWLVWLRPFQQTAHTTQLPVIICCITSHSPTQTQWLLIEADGSYINLEPEMEAAHFGHLTGLPDIYVLLKEMCYVQIIFTPRRKKGVYWEHLKNKDQSSRHLSWHLHLRLRFLFLGSAFSKVICASVLWHRPALCVKTGT